VRAIDRLPETHTDGEVAARLKAQGFRPGQPTAFTGRIVANLRRSYHLPDRCTRLRRVGLLTGDEVAHRLNVSPATIKLWRRHGLLRAQRYDDHRACLYEAPGPTAPIKWRRKFAPRPTAPAPADFAR